MLNVFKFSINDLLLGSKGLSNDLFAWTANLDKLSVFAIALNIFMTVLLTFLFSLLSGGALKRFSYLLLILALLASQPPRQEPWNSPKQEEHDKKK